MDFNYNVKKKWFGFWQKYKLKTHLRIASKLLLIFFVIWIIGSLLTILSQWAFTEHFAGTPFQLKYLKYFWPVIIELVSGYDINISLNMVSDILAVMVVITGLVIFAVFTGQIVSMFIHMLQRIDHFPEKPSQFAFRRPVLICGINNKFHNIIGELRRNPLTQDREIVVIHPQADEFTIAAKEQRPLYKDVWYVKGDPGDRDLLAGVIGSTESAAIILAAESDDQPGNRYADAPAIETAMAIEGYCENTHTVLELLDERNIPHLKHTKINEWISILEYGIRLVAQATLQHGMGRVFHHLLGNGRQPETTPLSRIHFSFVPLSIQGLTYRDLRSRLLENTDSDVTLIGFARHVPQDVLDQLDVDQGNSPYFKQLNPVNRICIHCSRPVSDQDPLGRVQRKCGLCINLEKQKNPRAGNSWHFPADTRLGPKDKLIYLAAEEMDFTYI